MTKRRRSVEVVVISDVHLGTYGSRAKELHHYLKSIKPNLLILNGDIIDIWQFSKSYWPKSHMRIIKQIFNMASKGVKIYYVTGNHDELLRKFTGFRMGSLQIVDKLVLDLDGKKAWIFHGDVFDVTMRYSKWLAQLGAIGYDMLILINAAMNFISEKSGRGRVSLSKRVKNTVKSAVKFINNFEHTAAEIAISNGYDYVVCGHIHHPEIRKISNEEGAVLYLNSGDWIESLTALEYKKGKWSLYQFQEEKQATEVVLEEDEVILDNKLIFNNLLAEFQLRKV
jgi:UDP-2,3-diacylglucosamine pyrophosphatase LpxH